MNRLQLSHNTLCDVLFALQSSDRDVNSLLNYIKGQYNISDEKLSVVEQKLNRFFMPTFKSKLSTAIYRENVFKQKNVVWLSGSLVVDFDEGVKTGGRPSAETFEGSSRATKYRKIQSITESHSAEEIQNAFFKVLRDCGKKHLINEIKKLLNDNSENSDPEEDPIFFSEDECIALIEDAKLSKWQYDTIRKRAKGKNANIFIPYDELASARERCYPQHSTMTITERGAVINLQQLLNHTCSRILQIPNLASSFANCNDKISVFMTSKWGCDGASDQSQYKQKFMDGTTADDSIFMISLVPLTLEVDSINGRQIIWRNPQCGSTRYCRVISFQYVKETPETIIAEVNKIKSQIQALSPTIIETSTQKFEVTHSMHLTMIDGKVCQALTRTLSSASCTICSAKPSQMNNFEELAKKVEIEENFKYGVSSLHAWIRFMECILHIAYRLTFCKWAAKTEKEKEQIKEAKERIQQEFRRRTGLFVDYPRQGSGSSNDGNTARRFFRDPQLASEITGIDQRLIERFGIILQVLACGLPIDATKFDVYAKETARLFVQLYGWFYMPSSVHKILLHGAGIINHYSLIPIGLLSEEAQESRNKDVKHYRKFNTRKCSRIHTNTDLLRKLLISSDPYISHFRFKAKNTKYIIDEAAKKMLIITEE